MAVPLTTFSTIPANQIARYKILENEFQKNYGQSPTFYARAPGRVNLIGEHVDYCGYAVLPMAIEQDIVIAASVNDNGNIHLCNVDPSYKPFQCNTSDIHIDKTAPKWYHYFLCGFRGILDHFGSSSVGLNLMLDGTVPCSAGLSSSSALVCCSAMVTMRANGKSLTKLELADLCQHCEHYIGTEGGGMDQSISFLAEQNTAKLIQFNPIRATDVKLPDGASFVISNSAVEMNKAATVHFNTRVAECRLATQVLAKSKGYNWQEFRRLGDLHSHIGASFSDMVQLVKDTLHKESYSKQEVCDILGVTSDDLNTISLSEKTVNLDSFQLHDRALHVYSEAGRVWQFRDICDQQPSDALSQLGQLMSASHASCSQLYQCSCEELDQLVALAEKSGSLGSRLTGAGWGGCAVSLVLGDHVDGFLNSVKEGYYSSDPDKSAKTNQHLFATQPSSGACFYVLKD